MKVHIIISIMMLVILGGCDSHQWVPDVKITDRIIEIPNFSKEEIFEKVQIWIAENFNSAKVVLEYSNKEDGVIIGNSLITGSWNNGMVNYCYEYEFTMRIDIKDNRFKISFKNLDPTYQGTLDEITPKLFLFGDRIKTFIINEKNETW